LGYVPLCEKCAENCKVVNAPGLFNFECELFKEVRMKSKCCGAEVKIINYGIKLLKKEV